MRQKLLTAYQKTFSKPAQSLIKSPGRVNIIGEHTDYNDGFVLPMALDEATWIALSPRDDQKISAYSLNFDAHENIDIEQLDKPTTILWPEYIKGVIEIFKDTYPQTLHGFDAVICSDIPMGAGLSSSASFELAIAKALSHVNQIKWDKTHMAILCQRAENEWIGVNCGIMDQLICSVAEKNHASMIDCRHLSFESAPLPHDSAIVIMDTTTRRGLVDSAYNERRKQCEKASKALGITALRDITYTELCQKESALDPLVFKRAKHVVSENERVAKALEAMRMQNSKQLGQLLKASHKSLNEDYEVTNDALNTIVNCAINTNGCFGARMTGAGFGGCAVALVEKHATLEFKHTVSHEYQQKTGLTPQIYLTQASEGCRLETLNAFQTA